MNIAARALLDHEVKMEMYSCHVEGRIVIESVEGIAIRRSFLASLLPVINATKIVFSDINHNAQTSPTLRFKLKYL